MTLEERRKPTVLNGSRRARIAAGAGVEVHDVNQLVQKYEETRKMVKKLQSSLPQQGNSRPRKGKKGKRKSKRGGMPQIPGLGQMSPADLKRLSDMLDNQ